MKSSKKIAVVCNYELKPERIGGMDRFFKAYNAELLQQGHRVSWFFTGSKSFDFYLDFDLHLSAEEPAETSFLNYIKARNHFDIIITHFLALCTPFYKELKNRNNAYIIAVDHNPRPLQGFPLKKRLKNKLKGRLYSRYTDCFIGVSQYTVDCILKDYGQNLHKKTQVVYNGIDTSIYKKRAADNHGKFIVASHLRESKGIQDLIEAVNKLPVEVKDIIKVDIFGEGPLEEKLKEKVELYQLTGQISFKGSSPNLPELFQQYSYLLQPTYMECFSLSILESLSANVPVVTTPVGGNPEIIKNGENGFLFEPGNVDELQELLEKILNKNIKITKNVDRLIREEFHLEKMVKNHIKLLPCI